jgi:CO/xanthine dehydrogenase Mo-binding subunit
MSARVGENVRRVDGDEKVQGRFVYASDLRCEGMLFGATLRSPHAHARIRDIDTSGAARIDGVCAVLTHDDVPGSEFFGIEVVDQPVLALDVVRHVGDVVAIVAAESEAAAREAVMRIHVEYEPLEAIVDPEQSQDFVRRIVITRGDPDARGDVVVSGTYSIGMQDQAFLGPEAAMAIPDGTGGVDIHAASQWLHGDRDAIAPCLGLDPERVRFHLAGVGGAFGGREDLSVQLHSALLALETGRPVRFVYEREESFNGHPHRHPALVWAEHRADRDGTLVCARVRILLDGGAYTSSSPTVLANAAAFCCGPYRIPNAAIEADCVYTNNPPAGAMRGYGALQGCFAGEAQMDKLAAALELDPVELRLRNALEPGEVMVTGERAPHSFPVREVIRRCVELEPPRARVPELPGVVRGIGFAIGMKNVGPAAGIDDSAAVRIVVHGGEPPRAEVHCAIAEVGQGIATVVVQVARSELGVDDVRLAPHTTTSVGSAGPSSASRGTWMLASATQLACRAAREEVARRGGSLAAGETVDVERTYRHTAADAGDDGTRRPEGVRSHAALALCAMKVAADVDVELGTVRVAWIGAAADVGHAIYPAGVYGQVEGGAAQGLGLALMEELDLDAGQITNASLREYLIPTACDVPPIETVLVEDAHPDGPYGAKGVGEPPTVVAPAAVAAAVRAACGRDLARLPIRAEAVAGV